MKPVFFTLLTALAANYTLQAQDIKGRVLDTNNAPYTSAEVSLLHSLDSTVFKYGFIDEKGVFTFPNIPNGYYIVKLEEGETEQYFSVVGHTNDKIYDLGDLVFEPQQDELEQVVFRYQRPLVEVSANGLVFNVDSTINSVGQNAFELMRKSPGVVVDKDENISLNGKNGVRIYVDGKLMPFTGSELSEYLKTLQSSSIDLIEIINNPSAKYDASGNAGIINIKLKKFKIKGTNGSVNAGYAVQKFSKYNGGFNLNHRNNKVNLFGSYNINDSKNWNEANFERTLMDSFYIMKSINESKYTGQTYKAGADYYVDDNNTFGLMFSGNNRSGNTNSNNVQRILGLPSNILASQLISSNEDENKRNNYNANLNYQYDNKNTGKSLNIDVDYARFGVNNDQYQPNIYYNEAGVQTGANIYNLLTNTQINIYTAKADYAQNWLGGKLSLGAKITSTNTDNDFGYKVQKNNTWNNDRQRSNTFAYNENIQAAYGEFQKRFKTKYNLQLGLRAENSITKGVSEGERLSGNNTYVSYTESNPRNYFNLFPTVGIGFQQNQYHNWNLRYSKRIDRPNYQDLNPFEYKMSDYSYRKGNVNLKPQIAHSASITHNYRYMLTTTLEYSHVNDVFAELVDTINGNRLFQTKENLAQQDIITLNVSAPFNYKKLFAFVNVSGYYSHYNADFGTGRTVNMDVVAMNLYGQVSYSINKWLSIETSGWYSSPTIWQGTFKSIAMGGLDVGAQAKVLKGKGTFKLSYGDVFNTMKWGGSSDFAGQKVKAYGRWESQQFRANFTYNFGSNKAKAKQRKTGAEEELKRTGDSQGLQQGK
jgi:iron complex outermembrane receptor protein